MQLDRVLGVPAICHAFRGGLAAASGRDACENLLAVLEGKASVYRLSGPESAAVMQVSLCFGNELWINAFSGKVPRVFECRDLWQKLAAAEGATVIRGRVFDNERLRAIYRRLGGILDADGRTVSLPVAVGGQ